MSSVDCPNEDCVDEDGDRNHFFRGSSECPICQTKSAECPHCGEVIAAKCFEGESLDDLPTCPRCGDALVKVPCPHCNHLIFDDLFRCPECNQPLHEMTACPSEECKEHGLYFYKGLNECPFCHQAVDECLHCGEYVLYEKIRSGGECSHCEQSFAKNNCPHCGIEVYERKAVCPNCKALLK